MLSTLQWWEAALQRVCIQWQWLGLQVPLPLIFSYFFVRCICVLGEMSVSLTTMSVRQAREKQMPTSQPCQHRVRHLSQTEHIYCETELKRTSCSANMSAEHIHTGNGWVPRGCPQDCPHSWSWPSSCSVCSVESPPGFPRLSYSLGMLDGSIQGAEEGTTFFHDTVEMHLMQKVALRVAEVLGTKPGQSRQAGILQKAPEGKQ